MKLNLQPGTTNIITNFYICPANKKKVCANYTVEQESRQRQRGVEPTGYLKWPLCSGFAISALSPMYFFLYWYWKEEMFAVKCHCCVSLACCTMWQGNECQNTGDFPRGCHYFSVVKRIGLFYFFPSTCLFVNGLTCRGPSMKPTPSLKACLSLVIVLTAKAR